MHLESPGQASLRQSACQARQALRAQARFEQRQARGGIAQLYTACKRRHRQPLEHAMGRFVAPGLPRRRRPEITRRANQLRTDGFGMRQQRGRRIRIGAHCRAAAAENTCLLEADGLAVRAQPVDMVQCHRNHQAAVGLHCIDRIEPPAQTHFQHAGGAAGLRERRQRRQRAVLEIGQCDPVTRGFDLAEGRQQRRIVDFLAIDADAFVVAQQVRRAVGADPVAVSSQHRAEVGGARALAVGTANQQCQRPRASRRHAAEYCCDALQPQLDVRGVQGFLPGQPFGDRGKRRRLAQTITVCSGAGRPVSLHSRAAISSRMLRRSTIMSTAPCSSRNSLR